MLLWLRDGVFEFVNFSYGDHSGRNIIRISWESSAEKANPGQQSAHQYQFIVIECFLRMCSLDTAPASAFNIKGEKITPFVQVNENSSRNARAQNKENRKLSYSDIIVRNNVSQTQEDDLRLQHPFCRFQARNR